MTGAGALPGEWAYEPNVLSVVAPCCAFTFSADHADVIGDGYSCPACEALDLERRAARTVEYAHDLLNGPLDINTRIVLQAVVKSLKTPSPAVTP